MIMMSRMGGENDSTWLFRKKERDCSIELIEAYLFNTGRHASLSDKTSLRLLPEKSPILRLSSPSRFCRKKNEYECHRNDRLTEY